MLSRESIFRLVCDILADEISQGRNCQLATLRPDTWQESTRVDDGGLGLDSLELLGCAAALNEFFHLHEYGAEDYLLQFPELGRWIDIICQSRDTCGTHLTFRTSGSTSQPKRCTHAVSDLLQEVAVWCQLLKSATRIVTAVPSHHIYGTLFNTFVPQHLNIPVHSARFANAAQLQNLLVPGTVLIGVPTLWQYFSRSLLAFPPGITGLTSTSPMPSHLASQLTGQRLDRLIEIYGSSETGGIGWRENAHQPFSLLDHWTRKDESSLVRAAATTPIPVEYPVMDAVEWLTDTAFMVIGRRDGALQIGGQNVFPERVRAHLLQHECVADCAVRYSEQTGRLLAFIVPAQASPVEDDLQQDLIKWCLHGLRAVDRPKGFAFGAEIPRTEMGKVARW